VHGQDAIHFQLQPAHDVLMHLPSREAFSNAPISMRLLEPMGNPHRRGGLAREYGFSCYKSTTDMMVPKRVASPEVYRVLKIQCFQRRKACDAWHSRLGHGVCSEEGLGSAAKPEQQRYG
jgi:hypothetical protein